MQITALHHTKMAEELDALRAAVPSIVELMLRWSLDEAF
jgi:hypothetical protein